MRIRPHVIAGPFYNRPPAAHPPALPSVVPYDGMPSLPRPVRLRPEGPRFVSPQDHAPRTLRIDDVDRKSTRLNSSHANISYAVFCLKKDNWTTSTFDSGGSPADRKRTGLNSSHPHISSGVFCLEDSSGVVLSILHLTGPCRRFSGGV